VEQADASTTVHDELAPRRAVPIGTDAYGLSGLFVVNVIRNGVSIGTLVVIDGVCTLEEIRSLIIDWRDQNADMG
jgi:hypothetical protein